jgi:hypothetical protein
MRVKNLSVSWQLRIGLLLLALASIVNFVARRAHGNMDFVSGLLFGMSFGMIMVAMWRNRPSPR